MSKRHFPVMFQFDESYSNVKMDKLRGVSCFVVNHPKDISKVVKLYYDAEEAIFAYHQQRIFARRQKAPKVYEIVTALFKEDIVMIGYVSEKAEIKSNKELQKIYPKWYNMFESYDLKDENVGLIDNNQLVLVDFGYDSFHHQKGKRYRQLLSQLVKS